MAVYGTSAIYYPIYCSDRPTWLHLSDEATLLLLLMSLRSSSMLPKDDEKVVVETLTAYLNGVALEALVYDEHNRRHKYIQNRPSSCRNVYVSCWSDALVHLYGMNKAQCPTQSLTLVVVFNPTSLRVI